MTRMLMKVPGFRNKLLADPSFAFKVGIEVGIGIVTKCSAELQKRGQNFKKEMDFVLANVLMALIADFMLVWLPAPAVSYGAAAAKKRALSLSKALPFLSKLPKNAFQKVPPGMQPYTLAQRVGVIGTNGAKLFGVGTFASFVGVAVTNTLIAVRERLGDAEDGQDSKPQTQPRRSRAQPAPHPAWRRSGPDPKWPRAPQPDSLHRERRDLPRARVARCP